jgi:hypothetical protein
MDQISVLIDVIFKSTKIQLAEAAAKYPLIRNFCLTMSLVPRDLLDLYEIKPRKPTIYRLGSRKPGDELPEQYQEGDQFATSSSDVIYVCHHRLIEQLNQDSQFDGESYSSLPLEWIVFEHFLPTWQDSVVFRVSNKIRFLYDEVTPDVDGNYHFAFKEYRCVVIADEYSAWLHFGDQIRAGSNSWQAWGIKVSKYVIHIHYFHTGE